MNIKDWTPPPGFVAGDTVRLAGLTGANTDPGVLSFVGWNLAEMIAWRKVNKEFVSRAQRARFDAAMNAAMKAADPRFVNHYDDTFGIRDPETNEWLHPPVPREPKPPKQPPKQPKKGRKS